MCAREHPQRQPRMATAWAQDWLFEPLEQSIQLTEEPASTGSLPSGPAATLPRASCAASLLRPSCGPLGSPACRSDTFSNAVIARRPCAGAAAAAGVAGAARAGDTAPAAPTCTGRFRSGPRTTAATRMRAWRMRRKARHLSADVCSPWSLRSVAAGMPLPSAVYTLLKLLPPPFQLQKCRRHASSVARRWNRQSCTRCRAWPM